MTDRESALVARMGSMISEHARRSNDPIELAVSGAIGEAMASGRVAAFEDKTLWSGSARHGAVVLGRLYLHASILDGAESLDVPYCPYPLEMLYHEGVHLTQSCVSLVFAAEASENGAREETKRFSDAWELERRGGR